MDRFDSMRLFVRVVDRRSFTAAAADLGLPRSTATEAIRHLESRLGVRLLERTTRHVAPTLDGEAYYRRCLSLLGDLEDAEGLFRNVQPRGLLRVDAHGLLTRAFVLPRLPEFLTQYPLIDLFIGQGDRLVDLVREGFDCVLRAGEISDSSLIVRKLVSLEKVTCASSAYLAEHGVPHSPDDLAGHRMVGFLSSRTQAVVPMELKVDGQTHHIVLPSRVTVNNSDSMADLGRYGFGLFQGPRYRVKADLESGVLVEVLKDYQPPPTALSALYPHSRQLSPRVRVFLDWVAEIFSKANI